MVKDVLCVSVAIGCFCHVLRIVQAGHSRREAGILAAVADCCDRDDYRSVFSERFARRTVRQYRKRGLTPAAEWIVQFASDHDVRGASVLEIGGGVGHIHVELLRRGAAHVTNLELSPEYEAEANRLLDEMGLTARNPAGLRLLPDGRPMEIVLDTAGERQEVADALELVAATWKELGLRLLVRPLDRDILRNRAYAGQSMMVAWYGWNNGVPTADADPGELAPVDQATYSWPAWGQHWQTRGSAGEAPDLPEAMRLLYLYRAWSAAGDREERALIWREMLAIHAEQVFVIGTVSRCPVPVTADARIRNLPDEVLYTWDPGGQFGIHRIDELWFAGGAQ